MNPPHFPSPPHLPPLPHRKNFLRVPANRKRGRHKTQRHHWGLHLRDWIWPSMGLKAWARWAMMTLIRTAENPHKVALGAAFGLLVSFIPILGTHTPTMLLLCYLFRGSFFAGLLGSLIGNPWTYGLMWWSGYEVGYRLLHIPPVNVHTLIEGGVSLSTLWYNAETILTKVIWPTFAGGMVVGGILSTGFFFVVRWNLRLWLKHRHEHMQAKRHQRLAAKHPTASHKKP